MRRATRTRFPNARTTPTTSAPTGRHVRLVPLTADRPDDLFGAAVALRGHPPGERQGTAGWTRYGRAHWRPPVNSWTKPPLSRAFEELGMGRVRLRTDHMNERPRAAITRP